MLNPIYQETKSRYFTPLERGDANITCVIKNGGKLNIYIRLDGPDNDIKTVDEDKSKHLKLVDTISATVFTTFNTGAIEYYLEVVGNDGDVVYTIA